MPAPSIDSRPARYLALGLLAAVGLGCSAGAHAQEIFLSAGPLTSGGNTTYSWEGSYFQGLGRYAAWSFSWLNEGHIPDNHRDGQTFQLWGRLPLDGNRLELSAGLGPYFFYDTYMPDAVGVPYYDSHGWGAVMSLRLACYFDDRWIAQLQLNRVQISGRPDTTALLLGIGYQLDGHAGAGPLAYPQAEPEPDLRNELSLMTGASILNSNDSETYASASLEYRRSLSPYVDASVSYIHEFGEVQSRRGGVAGQLWMTRAFLDDHLTLSAGAGPYVSITDNDALAPNATGDERYAGLVSVSASYRFDKRWLARLTWNRVLTRYDRDADLVQLGLGYRF
jgi:hypothetical protein